MKPCDGCAYTEGAEANREPHSNIKSQLCLLGGIAFYCHHSKDGTLMDLKDVPREEFREGVQAGRIQICQGWRREVKKLGVTGYYGRALVLKRSLASLGLGALQIFITTRDKAKKKMAAKNLKNVILSLNKARGFEVKET